MAYKLFALLVICNLIRIYCIDTFIDDLSVESNIKYINSVQSSWKAGNNSIIGFDSKSWKKKLGLKLTLKKLYKLKKSFTKKFSLKFGSTSSSSTIPQNYDAREAWPACSHVISRIRDQAACGSCWAVASASVLTDKQCIASNGTRNIPLSAEDLMRCCTDCTLPDGNGCNGGDIVDAMYFLHDSGIVTGGEYGSEEGCIPYSYRPCSTSNNTNGKKAECSYGQDDIKTQECQYNCSNSKYSQTYNNDKHFIDDARLLSSKDEASIQMHVMQGPGLALMEVYADFLYYEEGVYRHVEGKKMGNHVVRLIGWGESNGIKYWLAANSWGKSWGENGTFRIDRTKHGCKFAKYVIVVKERMKN